MSCEDPQHQLICREYDNLPALISFWGGLSWQKNQFFFAVESIAFAGVGVAFKSTFLDGAAPTKSAFLLLIGIYVFNLWICYVWFSTNRRNREYVNALLHRARQIEEALAKDQLAKDQLEEDKKATFSALPKKRQHSSSWWELHIPSGFAVTWTIALLTVARYGYSDWAVSMAMVSLSALVVFERPK